MNYEPMLARQLNGDIDTYALDSQYVFEQKIDGKRSVVVVENGKATAYNRQGLETSMPSSAANEFDGPAFKGTWVFDGEILGHVYWVFDVIACPGAEGTVTDLRDLALSARRQFLEQVFEQWHPDKVQLVRQEFIDVRKSMLVKKVHDNGGEGVVIKHLSSRYESGVRSHSWLKAKFTETHEVVVTELNRGGKDLAVTIGHYHNGELLEAGGLKIPPKQIDKIQVGSVVEVRYLYATADHKLYQPVFLRRRGDKLPTECTTLDIKYTDRRVLVDATA